MHAVHNLHKYAWVKDVRKQLKANHLRRKLAPKRRQKKLYICIIAPELRLSAREMPDNLSLNCTIDKIGDSNA
jgi:hypothetical protein